MKKIALSLISPDFFFEEIFKSGQENLYYFKCSEAKRLPSLWRLLVHKD